ncbi:Adenosine deaminase CECR1-A [Paramyrothecium foliicola]|nr:Adenosine deaminase CECR1-A [Paramyrothecium foliicola]
MSRPLVTPADYKPCKIRFLIRSDGEAASDPKTWSLFSEDYIGNEWMRYSQFLADFYKHYPDSSAEEWLCNKLVFHEEEVHNSIQTAEGAWELFNARTQMMKGLFNYETAYRSYTRACLQEFVNDNIQYAEIRVNFMKSNKVLSDDGSRQMENSEIVKLIRDEYESFQSTSGDVFKGLKIIYCTPRSFEPNVVKSALAECLKFKLDYPEYIAGQCSFCSFPFKVADPNIILGFDLVGEEAKGRPLKDFVAELLQFQEDCEASGVEIPLLLHCGETLDIGTKVDRNLVDALLLGCKRIGHGFALSRHPAIMEEMKAQNICLECCPISNQILGLTPRMSGHTIYGLLANNVHCSISSDNGTLFNSMLSRDFYQVLIGKADMTVYGWRQLIEWSIEHACMSEEERFSVFSAWEIKWDAWLQWVIQEYKHMLRD